MQTHKHTYVCPTQKLFQENRHAFIKWAANGIKSFDNDSQAEIEEKVSSNFTAIITEFMPGDLCDPC